MQDEIIWSKSPFGPPVSLQYRSGDPPYPSSQYPPYYYFFFLNWKKWLERLVGKKKRRKE